MKENSSYSGKGNWISEVLRGRREDETIISKAAKDANKTELYERMALSDCRSQSGC